MVLPCGQGAHARLDLCAGPRTTGRCPTPPTGDRAAPGCCRPAPPPSPAVAARPGPAASAVVAGHAAITGISREGRGPGRLLIMDRRLDSGVLAVPAVQERGLTGPGAGGEGSGTACPSAITTARSVSAWSRSCSGGKTLRTSSHQRPGQQPVRPAAPRAAADAPHPHARSARHRPRSGQDRDRASQTGPDRATSGRPVIRDRPDMWCLRRNVAPLDQPPTSSSSTLQTKAVYEDLDE